MFIIGLTGGVASGKTTATNYFLNKGIEIIDADEISRSLQIKGAEGYRKIIDKFGRKILNDDESINRKILRELAFSDATNKKWLENLMHPMIQKEVLTRLENVQSNWCVYSAPLWSAKHKFNRTLVIDAPEHIQLLRISERDGCTEEIARNIINNQISRQERNCFASDLIMNDGSIAEFQKKLDFYCKLYSDLAHEQKN